MQLVAYGAQDIYLTGNPQITFFKVVYRRHTNFAMESVAQTFDGQVVAGSACNVSATISRNGDLVHRVYLEVDTAAAMTDSTPLAFFNWVDHVELEIGGQLIDRQYGDWMRIWCELTHSASKFALLEQLSQKKASSTSTAAAGKTWVPLQFSFCRNPGLAIPLIALQYHEVKLNFKFTSQLPAGSTVCLWCDYIYLDTDERRRFAQTSHEYLIEQVQANRKNNMTAGCVNKVPLTFNHPVKELVWFQAADDEINSAVLKLNGHERFAKRHGHYFSKVQRYQHHTGDGPGTASNNRVYLYSFALQPEEHQPSGTCNMSRIDNAVLELESGTTDCVDIYAVNYNVLRVMSGMGGLAYSN